MTLLDLANSIDSTVTDLVKYYEEIRGEILPIDGSYVLSFELAKKANFKLTRDQYESFDANAPIISNVIVSSKSDKSKDEDRHFINRNDKDLNKSSVEKDTTMEKSIYKFFDWSEKELIQEILIYNRKDSLVLKGLYSPDFQGRDLGFFVDVRHIDGTNLEYPLALGNIDRVVVFTNKLIRGQEYTFEAKLARLKARETKENPFLIQANSKSINEVIELSELTSLIIGKQIELDQLKNTIKDLDEEFLLKKQEILTQIDISKEEKQKEADVILEKIDNEIEAKILETQTIQLKIDELGLKKSETENKLIDLKRTKINMESTINFLRQKIELCKNLEFLSHHEADKYLDIFKTDSLEIPDGYLNFEEHFSSNYGKLAEHIQYYLYKKKGLIYTRFQIQNYLSLLMTHDIIVLSGLSGSGKTQIVKAFAEALGGVAKIIPVKPNWTSSEDLLGYYNPMQSSFLPTPFTEALVEARQNPNRLYFICLDEMNLARAEYYFADFLSKLEERDKEPEIELYSKHEEEMFISEFGTLLSLFENAMSDKKITSWQEFLSDNDSRNRFFDLLGTMEKDTMLKIHSKMKRRLIDILKFPATITIPSNVRFIGAINVDETTHYFSPKILDRVHIVKFENPLLFESIVASKLDEYISDNELKPVYLRPSELGERKEFPLLRSNGFDYMINFLKEINKKYLLNLSIDFGVRSIRQSINFSRYFNGTCLDNPNFIEHDFIGLNAILNQKILPRFVFDGTETTKSGETKIEVIKRLSEELKKEFEIINNPNLDFYDTGYLSFNYLDELISVAEKNNGQINFFA